MDFLPFYEVFEYILGIYNHNFSIVFQSFFLEGGYNQMAFVLFGVPIIALLLFYFMWKYPYGTLMHWFIFVAIIAIIVAGLTYSSVRLALRDSLNSTDPPTVDFAISLVLKYTMLNAFLSILVSFLYSWGLKRFSKVQMHLPF